MTATQELKATARADAGKGAARAVRRSGAVPGIVYGESQDGNIFRTNLRTGQGARIRPIPAQGQPGYRFNWNTPFILSSHNSHIWSWRPRKLRPTALSWMRFSLTSASCRSSSSRPCDS